MYLAAACRLALAFTSLAEPDDAISVMSCLYMFLILLGFGKTSTMSQSCQPLIASYEAECQQTLPVTLVNACKYSFLASVSTALVVR